MTPEHGRRAGARARRGACRRADACTRGARSSASAASRSPPGGRSRRCWPAQYHSVFKGRGMAFAEVRAYCPGDEVRAIDWNVTARTGEPAREAVHRGARADRDAPRPTSRPRRTSAPGAQRSSRRRPSCRRCSRFGRRERRQGRPAAVPRRRRRVHPAAQGRQARAAHRPRGARARQGRCAKVPRSATLLPRFVRRWFKKLQDRPQSEPRRATSIAAALEFCRQVLPRRAVLFLISDFLDDGYIQVLRHANRKHDVVASLITDPREADDAAGGPRHARRRRVRQARGSSTRGARRSATSSRSVPRHARRSSQDQLRATGMDLVAFDASGSMVDPLLKFFRERERRLRR